MDSVELTSFPQFSNVLLLNLDSHVGISSDLRIFSSDQTLNIVFLSVALPGGVEVCNGRGQ